VSYQHIEEIQGRKGEKIALFLTLENALGLVLSAFPAYLVTAAAPAAVRIAAVIVAALLGIGVTLDVGGMAGYERIAWRVRGALRLRVQPVAIRPEQLTGSSLAIRYDRPLMVGGPVQIRPAVARGILLPGSSQGITAAPPSGAVDVAGVLPAASHKDTPTSGTGDDDVLL
jgi:hypothetical protein